MKKLVFIFAGILFFSSCAVTSDKFQFQKRMDNFYKLLNKDEIADFSKGDYTAFSNSMDSRLSNDQKLASAFSLVQENEAITTFDSFQTANFFRETILLELNRANYYRFMNFLDAKKQEAFVRGDSFQEQFDSMYKTDGNFRGFIDNLRTEYRLVGFSNDEITAFFRNVCFAEASRKEVYYLLQLLNEINCINDFLKGDIKTASAKLDEGAGDSHPLQSDELDSIRKLSGLTEVSSSTLLDLYYSVIMKEMDPYALSRTIETVQK